MLLKSKLYASVDDEAAVLSQKTPECPSVRKEPVLISRNPPRVRYIRVSVMFNI